MAARAEAEIRGGTLVIRGVLDFDSVVELEADGQRWLSGDAPTQSQIDLAGVSYSTSAGIALLLGWLRAADHAQKKLKIVHMPADMAALVRVGGLSDLIPSA